ncbi:aflatoxin regulatory protein-domain-containing protein [Phialemonium atrogriseum]|uniref:Aflatoxin regulatory protein-domain-containing protein n=1 Tax=Phialemonium atrogriseum TaxID=1093897 RepID=A0AAJ0BSQ3_9PEZI|nr:aflatoxin regulatory protein-domain-containing protein [Phialemonium atrogriseum]KAK1763352.1 aflatoxin regulatory protein-domain-containing protein [Phialemonium atrogriseum]
MAASHSPGSGIPTPSPSTSRRSAAPAGPKLRDSCYACASSKVKCHKEKPTCSRCAKRGLVCEYVATRRGGRTNHERRSTVSEGSSCTTTASSSSTINVKHSMHPPGNWFATNSMVSADYLPSPALVDPSPRPTAPGTSSSSLFPNVGPVNPDPALSSSGMPEYSTADLDDFFASPMSFSMPGTVDPDPDPADQAHFFSTGIDSSSSSHGGGSASGPGSNGTSATTLLDTFAFLEDTLFEMHPLSHPRSTPNSGASPANYEQPPYQASSTSAAAAADSAPCCCLVQALGFMKQLFPNTSTACAAWAKQDGGGHHEGTATPPTIQTVIAKNRGTIEAIGSMLQCSCSHDGFLLSLMALIVFKVLRWYAAAAGKGRGAGLTNSSSSSSSSSSSVVDGGSGRHLCHLEQVLHAPAVVGSYCLEGEDSAHMAAQLVLSELHRVQRLVNQLSARLKECMDGEAAGGADEEGGRGGEPGSAFSAVILDHFGMDLRKQLRALSLEIVDGLRKE